MDKIIVEKRNSINMANKSISGVLVHIEVPIFKNEKVEKERKVYQITANIIADYITGALYSGDPLCFIKLMDNYIGVAAEKMNKEIQDSIKLRKDE